MPKPPVPEEVPQVPEEVPEEVQPDINPINFHCVMNNIAHPDKDTIADNPLCSGAAAILICGRPTLAAPFCLQDHTVLRTIK